MQEPHRSGRGRVSVLLGGAVLSFLCTVAVTLTDGIALGRTTAASWLAYAGYVGAYLLLLAGVLTLAWCSLARESRIRMLLDGLLVIAGAAPFSWFYIIGPAFEQTQATAMTGLAQLAHAVAGLGLLFGLVALSAALRHPAMRRTAILLAVALTAVGAADAVRLYQEVHGIGGYPEVLEAVQLLGFLLVGAMALAVWVSRNTPVHARPESPSQGDSAGSPPDMPRPWRYLLPYVPVPAVMALAVYVTQHDANADLVTGVYILGSVLVEIVFLHQFLDYRELLAYANRNARLETLVSVDSVTGLPNHREIVANLDQEIERSRRYSRLCSVIFLDLDHFKALNDSFGHPAGDAALREFGSVVRTALRSPDILGRWGGEEFVAMLPETDTESAAVVAERIRTAVAEHSFWAAGGAHLTCSAGVATFPHDGESRDVLIEIADRAMYAAKRLGRNQVCIANDPAVVTDSGNGALAARDEAALAGTVEALVSMLGVHDRQSSEHAYMVSALASRIALEMGLDTSAAYMVGLAGRLHDLGKVGVPNGILRKPSHLTSEEWRIIQAYPALGASIVSRIPALRALAPIIRAHHEHWDGKGYPDGLAGTAIPPSARILAVADAFINITTDGPYRRARHPDTAMAEIRRCSGGQFDPEVVEALHQMLLKDGNLVASVGVA